MGEFDNIKCIGKYAARLGQSLSSSIDSFQTDSYRIIPDIYVEPHKQYCFTDGIGKISIEKAMEICKLYPNKDYLSAFQIRFGGFKGMTKKF